MYVLKLLPKAITRELTDTEHIEELRLRTGRAAIAQYRGTEKVLSAVTTQQDIANIALMLTRHSLYAFENELSQGLFTIQGGVRVGGGGRVVMRGGRVYMPGGFTSLCLRFPRQMRGVAKPLMPFITENGNVLSTLIISPPGMGKTTLLRDVILRLSSEKKVCVADERAELYGGGAFDLGPRTDVIYGCPKSFALSMALRALSPEVAATDEIGGEGDLAAIRENANCGVALIATAHGSSIEEITRRPFFAELLRLDIFRRIVVLSQSLGRGTLEQVLSQGKNILPAPILLRGQKTEEEETC